MKVYWVFFFKGGWLLKVVINIVNFFVKQILNEYLEGVELNFILFNFGLLIYILIKYIYILYIGLLKFFL